MTARQRKAVIITLDEDHLSDIKNVTDKCQEAGLELHDALEFLGQITGEIDPDKEGKLRKIPGVLSVEESQEIKLPPPDSDVQ